MMTSTNKFSIFQLLQAIAGSLVLLFILAPLVGMFLRTSGTQLVKTAAEPEVYKSIYLTLGASLAATVTVALAAVPFAHFLARKEFPGKRILTGIIDLPVVIPHSAAGIALLSIFSARGAVGKVAGIFNIEFVGTVAGISVAMAFVSIPFLINAARNGFEAVPEKLEKAAQTLGASPARVFFTISLPMAWRSVLTGMVMMWSRGLSEFGAVVVIAYYPLITPVLIYKRFCDFGLKYAQPVATLFILVCFAVFVLLRVLAGGKHHARH